MGTKKFWTGVAAAGGMFVLILDSKTAISGMQTGISLVIQTLIPSLFPFFILSILLTGSLLGRKIRFLAPIGKICGIPEGGESLLAVSLLGGYPVGAQNVALGYECGALSRAEAERMLAFCNNAGPSFLFGIVGFMFDKPQIAWMLWGIHIFSAIAVGVATKRSDSNHEISVPEISISLTDALRRALSVMAQTAGWVVLFRMIIAYLERWFLWLLPQELQVFAIGILELSNGCVRLRSIEDTGLRFVIASVLLALGGSCVSFQTGAVTGSLRLRNYFPGKLLQGVISLFLTLALQRLAPIEHLYTPSPVFIAVALVIGLCSYCALRKDKNSSSIISAVGV